MGGAAQQAGQHYRQRPRGSQPRHRACAYRARPSWTHLVRHALAHKMFAHVGVRVSGVRRKPCTERLISFRSIHCAALVSRFQHGPGRFYLSAPSLRNLHFRADWSSEGFTRCSLSTPMGCDIRVKKCTLLPKERALFDMAHAELVGLERTPRKRHRDLCAVGRRPRGPSQAELRRPRRASNGTGPSAAVKRKVRTGPTARSAPGTLIGHHCLPS